MNRLQKFFQPVDMTVGRPWEDILIFTILDSLILEHLQRYEAKSLSILLITENS